MPSLLCQGLCIISNPLVNSNWSYNLEKLNSGQNRQFFCLVWPWNLMDDLENNRAPFLYSIKLCALFQSHQCIQTGVTVQKYSIQVKIRDFLSHVTLKFNGWPWKIIEHLSYTILTFVHHFVAIGEFKQESQSKNAQFGSKSTILLPTWPWNLIDDLEKQ